MTTGHYKNLHSVWHWVKDCPNLRLCVFWIRLHYEIHTRKLWMFICYWALLIPREENTFFTLLQVKQFLLIHSTQKWHNTWFSKSGRHTHFNMKSKLGLCSRSPGYNCCVASMASPTRPANTSFCIPGSTKKQMRWRNYRCVLLLICLKGHIIHF